MKTTIKIYQLNDEKNETRNYKYMDYDFLKENNLTLNLDLYNEVYEFEVEDVKSLGSMTEVCDRIYTRFNLNHPEDFKGHSLSTSDIIMIGERYFYCDSYGWVEVKFEKPKVKKTINIEVLDGGERYFKIYEVRSVKVVTEEVITNDRFLSREEAEEHVNFLDKNLKSLYSVNYIKECWVWC